MHTVSAVLRPFLLVTGLALSAMAWGQTTHTVMVVDNAFQPANITIDAGDTVRWVNNPGGNPHNVTSNTGAFAASGTASSFEFEVTFDDPGVYNYSCTVHFGMNGSVTVEGQAAQAEVALQSVNAADGSYQSGDMMAITSMIENTGDAGSGNFTITYYASEDDTITGGDFMLGSAQIGNLGAGADMQHNGQISWPQAVPAGTYFIGAILSINDGNQANNTNRDATTVVYLRLFQINAGLNDAWLNFATGGQGFFFTVFPDIEAFFLSWFTFDVELPDEGVEAILGYAGHRWVTAFGDWDGNVVTLDVELTEGGLFDSEEPAVSQTPEYGTITIVFHDCNNATLTYNFPGLGLMGEIELTRVTLDNVALCQALNAELQP